MGYSPETTTFPEEWTVSFFLNHGSAARFYINVQKRFSLEISSTKDKYTIDYKSEGATAESIEHNSLSPGVWQEFCFGGSKKQQRVFLEIKNGITGGVIHALEERSTSITMASVLNSKLEFKEINNSPDVMLKEIKVFGDYLPFMDLRAPLSPFGEIIKLSSYYRLNEGWGNNIYDSAGGTYIQTTSSPDFQWVDDVALPYSHCQYPYQYYDDVSCNVSLFKVAFFQPPPGNGGKYILWENGKYKCYLDQGKYLISADDPCSLEDLLLNPRTGNINVRVISDNLQLSSLQDIRVTPPLQISNYTTNGFYINSENLEEKIYKLELLLSQGGTIIHRLSHLFYIDLLPLQEETELNKVNILYIIYLVTCTIRTLRNGIGK